MKFTVRHRLLLLGVALLCALPTGATANLLSSARQSPDACDPQFVLQYDEVKVTMDLEIDKTCVEQRGLGTITVKVSLERCALDCSIVIRRTIRCDTTGRCKRTFPHEHDPIETANYTARMSYSSDGRRVVAGMATRSSDCHSVVAEGFCT